MGGVTGEVGSSSNPQIIENAYNTSDIVFSTGAAKVNAGGIAGKGDYTEFKFTYNIGDIEITSLGTYVGEYRLVMLTIIAKHTIALTQETFMENQLYYQITLMLVGYSHIRVM